LLGIVAFSLELLYWSKTTAVLCSGVRWILKIYYYGVGHLLVTKELKYTEMTLCTPQSGRHHGAKNG
jgi:hypothetical protein